jgi:hypothetical protein
VGVSLSLLYEEGVYKAGIGVVKEGTARGEVSIERGRAETKEREAHEEWGGEWRGNE